MNDMMHQSKDLPMDLPIELWSSIAKITQTERASVQNLMGASSLLRRACSSLIRGLEARHIKDLEYFPTEWT